MSWTFDIAAGQAVGNRLGQEDAFGFTRSSNDADRGEFAALLLADGAGGQESGEIASHIAIAAIDRTVSPARTMADAPRMLRKAIARANAEIETAVNKGIGTDGMGCTVVAAVIDAGMLYWASVGDSHLYRSRRGALEKLNEDHSYGGMLELMARRGRSVERNPMWPLNALVSAVSGGDIARIDCPKEGEELKPGDRLLLASDGLDTLTRDEVKPVLLAATSSAACVDALLDAVAKAGEPTQDNTTVVVASVNAKDSSESTQSDPVVDSFESRILRDYVQGVGTLEDA